MYLKHRLFDKVMEEVRFKIAFHAPEIPNHITKPNNYDNEYLQRMPPCPFPKQHCSYYSQE